MKDTDDKMKLLSFAGSERNIADPWYIGNFDQTYVALAALAGLRVAYDVIHFGCAALAVLASVLLILLVKPKPTV